MLPSFGGVSLCPPILPAEILPQAPLSWEPLMPSPSLAGFSIQPSHSGFPFSFPTTWKVPHGPSPPMTPHWAWGTWEDPRGAGVGHTCRGGKRNGVPGTAEGVVAPGDLVLWGGGRVTRTVG